MFKNASDALRDFWASADVGGRDRKNGSLFKMREEVGIDSERGLFTWAEWIEC